MESERQTGNVTVSPDLTGLSGYYIRIRTASLAGLLVWLILATAYCQAQDDFYPVPERNPSGFGFPYPPPAPDEPGVSFNRRYILDGHPELQFCPRPQDEVWLISTRDIESPESLVSLDQFVCKHVDGTGWNQVPVQQLIDVQHTNPNMTTVIFIHGNRTPAFWARRRGKHAYQALLGNNPANLPPVRFVIWSWPSDPLSRPAQDFQKKMDRSVVDGLLFGRFLSALDHSRPVKLVAYSLGTQVALTGVETVSACSGNAFQTEMISMAPVTHCCWPSSAGQLETTASRIGRLRLFRNDVDIALNAYKTYCSLCRGRGFTVGADRIARVHPEVVQFDVSEGVGREHNILSYVLQPGVRQELNSILGQ